MASVPLDALLMRIMRIASKIKTTRINKRITRSLIITITKAHRIKRIFQISIIINIIIITIRITRRINSSGLSELRLYIQNIKQCSP